MSPSNTMHNTSHNNIYNINNCSQRSRSRDSYRKKHLFKYNTFPTIQGKQNPKTLQLLQISIPSLFMSYIHFILLFKTFPHNLSPLIFSPWALSSSYFSLQGIVVNFTDSDLIPIFHLHFIDSIEEMVVSKPVIAGRVRCLSPLDF